jgi:hypothetical protein
MPGAGRQASPLAPRGVQRMRWAQISDETSQNFLDVEEFLAGLHFKQRSKLAELPITLR